MISSTNFAPRLVFGLLLRSALVLGTPVSTTSATSTTSYVGMWDATISPSPTSSSTCLSSSSSSTTCSRSICVDGINECGQMFGGCFLDPACTGGTVWPTFSKPPCSSSSSSSKTCTQSICADYINECGMPYGGCFLDPQCTGGTAWPTFSKPPCPTSVSSKITSFSHYSSACTQSICVDKVNSCGLKYGGCFLDPKCTGGSAWPTFTPPPCPSYGSSISKSSSSTPTSYAGGSSSSSSSCSRTICADYVNECGQPYGGCFLDPYCTGGTVMPTFSKPPCSYTITDSSSSSTKSYSATSATCTRSLCADSINECGIPYGGCFLDPKCTGGSVFPTFPKPPCPTSSTTVSIPAYPTVTAITTLIYYTTSSPPGGTVTVVKTSTSLYIVPVASIVANSTYIYTSSTHTIPNNTHANTSAPEPTPSAPLFTGAGARNFAEIGVIVLLVAVGAVVL